tara:strand:- start:3229 stop:4728 length:1500 start_codon:yes stop_codon:yes gene_type:complete
MANGNRVEEFLNQNNLMAEAGVQPGQEPGFEFLTMIKNMGPSVKKNVGDVVQAISHPIQTGQGLMSTAGGYVSKAGIPGLSQYEPYADAMNQFFVDRYGSKEAFFNTLEQDPAGALMDLSTVFTGVGGAVRAGGNIASKVPVPNAGLMGERISGIGQNIQRAGNAIDPINQGLNAVYGGLGALIPEKLPESLYAGGAKPGTTLSRAERKNFNRTAVEQGIMPNDAGLARFSGLIDYYVNKVDGLIAQATDSGRNVDATRLFDDLIDLKERVNSGGSIDKIGDLKQIEKVEMKLAESIYGQEAADYIDFTDLANTTAPRNLSASDLQALKQDAYKRSNFGKRTNKPDMRNEANRAVGSAARKGVEELTLPENPTPRQIARNPVAGANRQLGNLLDMQVPLERAAGRIDQRNLVSLPQTIGAAAGVGAGDFGTGILGYLLGSIITPENQARAGIGVERMRQIPRNPIQSLLSPAPGRNAVRAGAYGGRLQEGLQRQGLLGR